MGHGKFARVDADKAAVEFPGDTFRGGPDGGYGRAGAEFDDGEACGLCFKRSKPIQQAVMLGDVSSFEPREVAKHQDIWPGGSAATRATRERWPCAKRGFIHVHLFIRGVPYVFRAIIGALKVMN